MAITFKLKYGHSSLSFNYIDLTDAAHGNGDYVPEAPEEGADEQSESALWWIRGTTLADMIAKVNAIEEVFRMAAEYDDEQVGAYQVFVTSQLDGALDIWQSQIFEGRVNPPKSQFTGDWATFEHQFQITWRRSAYWERLMDIPSANDNHSKTTSPINVYNWNDGTGSSPNKKVNLLDILAADVPGNLPAPVVLEIQLGSGAVTASRFNQLMVMNNAKTQPTIFPYWSEGEADLLDTSDTNRSGAKYHDYPIPANAVGLNIDNHESVNAFTGAWVRFLVSAKFTGTIKARPYVSINGIYYYGDTSIFTSDGAHFRLYDLGLKYMPSIPTGYGGLVNVSIYTGINIICPTGITFSLDYFLSTPVDYFVQADLDATIAVQSNMIIDCHDQFTYEVDHLGFLTGGGTVMGGLSLVPNSANRLIFKFAVSGVDPAMDAGAILSVKVHAWIRKKTL